MGVCVLNKRQAVFLDRDGVINRNVINAHTGKWESPMTIDDFEMQSDALNALHSLSRAEFLLFLVSNQPNYAKAKSTLETLDNIHQRFVQTLIREDIEFAAFYYCFHHPEGVVADYSGACQCRKPSPFFLFRARDEFCLDMKRSWMIGDRETDIDCGHAAGVRTIRVFNQEEESNPKRRETRAEFQATSLASAVGIILGLSKN
jgi:D-glycero-D-manno-heptose 1,7-bisphosphate phosphatase